MRHKHGWHVFLTFYERNGLPTNYLEPIKYNVKHNCKPLIFKFPILILKHKNKWVKLIFII